MTIIRSIGFGAACLGALWASSLLAAPQTTSRSGAAPARNQPAAGQKSGASPAPKDGKNASGEGKATPITSLPQKKGAAKDDEPAARTAKLPNSASRSDVKPNTTARLTDGEKTPPPLPEPEAPKWAHKISPEEQKYIDQVLAYWEASTKKIKTYKCDFEKFTYNPNFAPPGTYYEHSTGVIMYAQPDKGLYRVDAIDRYRPPKEKGGKPEYARAEGEKGEHWICDGKAIYYFDYLNKILRKTNLPPVMQGQAIADGPLPFVFGAEAEKIKQRYWLKVMTPEGKTDEIWLAAVPKWREDAANYKEVLIVIDYESYLPKAMTVFMPGFDAKTNPAKENYIFKKRENNLAAAIWNPLAREFYQPSTPAGWKLEVQEVPREEPQRQAAPRVSVPEITKQPAAGAAANKQR